MASVQDALAAVEPVRQWLPIDGRGQDSLDRLIAADSTGPLRWASGGWRDRITGLQFHDGRGRLITVGGLPVKNVAGYDLAKLLVGSGGCFGTVVAVAVRTERRPEAAYVAKLACPDGVAAAVNKLITSAAPPRWILLDGDGLRAGWLGLKRDIDAAATAATQGQRRDPEDDDADRLAAQWPAAEVVRTQVAPADVEAVATEVAAEVGSVAWAADAAFGRMWFDVKARDAALAAVRRRGGTAELLHADGTRTSLDRPSEPVLRLMRRLKQEFDPDGRLA